MQITIGKHWAGHVWNALMFCLTIKLHNSNHPESEAPKREARQDLVGEPEAPLKSLQAWTSHAVTKMLED